MPTARTPDELLTGPIAEDDGRGIGSTVGPDVSVEAERREIERAVYGRRNVSGSEPRQPQPQTVGDGAPPVADDDAENEQAAARQDHARSPSGQPAAPDQTRRRD